jgi:hypothetical protein
MIRILQLPYLSSPFRKGGRESPPLPRFTCGDRKGNPPHPSYKFVRNMFLRIAVFQKQRSHCTSNTAFAVQPLLGLNTLLALHITIINGKPKEQLTLKRVIFYFLSNYHRTTVLYST